MKKVNSRKKTLLATGLASLALLATISTATYAWFSISTTVTVGVSSLTAVAGDNIMISEDGGATWGSTISMELDELDSTVTDISGNGENFFTKSGYETTEYVEFDLQFKATSYYAIYLNNSSNVVPNAALLQGASAGNKSAYGDFSKDYIAAAVRIAFLDEDNHVRLVWAPNSNIVLGGSAGSYTVATNGAQASYNYSLGESNTAFSTDAPGFLATSQSEQGKTGEAVEVFSGNKNFLGVIAPTAYGQTATATIKVRIWIEGNDPECVNPFLGGVFNTTLGFSATELTQETRPTVNTVAIGSDDAITGYNLVLDGVQAGDYSKYEVSTNNQGTWSDYSASAVYANQTVYVRKKAAYSTGDIPSAAARVIVGKKTQAAPLAGLFTANASTRTLSASSYATSAVSGGALQYSLDQVVWSTMSAAVTNPSLARTPYYVRYAANGDYAESEATEVVMIAKRGTVSATAVAAMLGNPGTGTITVTAGYKYTIGADNSTALSAFLEGHGSPDFFTADTNVIGIYQVGDNGVNYADGDVTWYQVNFATNAISAYTGA